MTIRDHDRAEVLTARRHPSGRVRRPESWAALGSSLVLFEVTGLLVVAGDAGLLEGGVFHVFNGLPGWVGPPLTAVMQLGWWTTVLLVAAVLVLERRYRIALDVAVAGALAHLAVVLAGPTYARGRPADLLAEVVDRGSSDAGAFGFPSGHVAVAAAVVAVLAPHVPRRLRVWWWALVPLVMVSRMYVGAHLPLDTVGGLLVGVAAASAVQLVLGVRDPDAHLDDRAVRPSVTPTKAWVTASRWGRGCRSASDRPLGDDAVLPPDVHARRARYWFRGQRSAVIPRIGP